MLGVIVNVITVIIGSLIGLLFKKGIPERVSTAAMIGLGACTLYIGISGSLCGENVFKDLGEDWIKRKIMNLLWDDEPTHKQEFSATDGRENAHHIMDDVLRMVLFVIKIFPYEC